MRNKRLIVYALSFTGFLFGIGAAFVLTRSGENAFSDEVLRVKSDDFEKGPHRGRLLRDGHFSLEITIFETNAPPVFRLYAYEKDIPVAPETVQARIAISRLDGEVNSFTFKPKQDYLEGSSPIAEPHSFDVTIEASFKKLPHKWNYSSYEGRTTIMSDAARVAGIKSEVAGPLPITETLSRSGRIILDPNRSSMLNARFPGIIKQVRNDIGDQVKAGDTLAVIESNDSLGQYELKTPITGKIVSRSARVGDLTNDAPLFAVADLKTVLAEFPIFSQDISRVKSGQKVTIRSLDGEHRLTATIDLVAPVADPESQSTFVRVRIPNPENQWQPGFMIMGDIVVSNRTAPLAVRSSAVQRFRNFQVVFAQTENTFEARMLELGANDGTNVEVISGLKPGTRYVTENSFLIKADIEKSGASHDH